MEEKNTIFRLVSLAIVAQFDSGNDSTAADVGFAEMRQGMSKKLLKEGTLEKKGHGLGVFNWVRDSSACYDVIEYGAVIERTWTRRL